MPRSILAASRDVCDRLSHQGYGETVFDSRKGCKERKRLGCPKHPRTHAPCVQSDARAIVAARRGLSNTQSQQKGSSHPGTGKRDEQPAAGSQRSVTVIRSRIS